MRSTLLLLFLLSTLTLCVLPNQAYAINPLSYTENHCLSFDGADDYISCGSPDVEVYKAGKLTVELWIKPTYTIENGSDVKYGHITGAIISYTETWASQGGWALYFDFSDGHLWFKYRSAGGTDPYTGQPYPPFTRQVSTNRAVWNSSSWYHLAITFVPYNYLVFYVNRTIDKTYEDVKSLVYEGASLKVGGHLTYENMFGGLIDEVRFWNVSRTQSGIINTWNRVLNETECAQPELIGYWRFDEGSGDISEDYSAQDNDAILGLAPYNPTWVDYGAPIIPEFPSAIILPLFMVLSVIAVVFAKRGFPRKSKT